MSTIRSLKRPELYLDLAQALPQQQFRMIGGPGVGEVALWEATRARARELGNVRFLGFAPLSQVEEQFDGATLFVNTSDSEGFPNTFLQAWARGIPTVSFVDSGARLDGVPVGLRVSSLEQLVATVSEQLSNVQARLKLGQRCAEYVEKHHSPEKIVELYARAFEELVSSMSHVTAGNTGRSEQAAAGDRQR